MRDEYNRLLLQGWFPWAKKPSRSSIARPGHEGSRQDELGQARSGQDRPGQARTWQARSGQDMTGQDRTDQDRTGQDRICPWPGQASGQASGQTSGQARAGQRAGQKAGQRAGVEGRGRGQGQGQDKTRQGQGRARQDYFWVALSTLKKTLGSRLLDDWDDIEWTMITYRWLTKWEQVKNTHQEIKTHDISPDS